jgi:hypothetical protein
MESDHLFLQNLRDSLVLFDDIFHLDAVSGQIRSDIVLREWVIILNLFERVVIHIPRLKGRIAWCQERGRARFIRWGTWFGDALFAVWLRGELIHNEGLSFLDDSLPCGSVRWQANWDWRPWKVDFGILFFRKDTLVLALEAGEKGRARTSPLPKEYFVSSQFLAFAFRFFRHQRTSTTINESRDETRQDDEGNLNVFMRQILLFLIKEVRGQET